MIRDDPNQFPTPDPAKDYRIYKKRLNFDILECKGEIQALGSGY